MKTLIASCRILILLASAACAVAQSTQEADDRRAAAIAKAAAASAAKEPIDSNVRVVDGIEVLVPIQHPGATKPSFTISIRGGDNIGTRTEFKIGSVVAVTVSRTNIVDHNIDNSSVYRHLDEGYNYLVWDEDGKPAEKRNFGDPDRSTAKPVWAGIAPGETDFYEADLEQIYKFDKPGKYTVQISRPDPDFLDKDGKPTVIKSNIITITITG